MADIIDEINEELKQERMRALFAKYGKYVGALAAAVIVIVVAIQSYGFYQTQQREQAANAYYNALGNDDIVAGLAQAAPELNDGYAMLARFVTAADLLQDDKASDAIAIYDALSADETVAMIYRQFADLLYVTHAGDAASADDLMARLSPIADNAGPLQGLAFELQADVALRSGDVDGAIAYLKQVETLQDAPNGLRQRVAALLIILGYES